MGTLGIRMDRRTASQCVNNLLKEIYPTHIDFDIDNILVAGSIRRGKLNDIGDIDIILVTLSGEIPKGFSDYLANELGFSIDAAGSKLVRSLTSSGVQFDFYSCLEDQFPYMLAYLTGPQEFNIGMRSQARKLGYKLNQFGLTDTKTGAMIQGIQNEHQLFTLLGLNFIDPSKRGSWYQNYRDYKLK